MSTPVQALFDLTGQVALVTGGSRGLGLQMAQLVARSHGGRLELPDVPGGFAVDLCWDMALSPLDGRPDPAVVPNAEPTAASTTTSTAASTPPNPT